VPDRDEWFSDEALRRQAEARRLDAAGERVPFELICGILEPRVPPTPEECCYHCGSDARSEVGGEEYPLPCPTPCDEACTSPCHELHDNAVRFAHAPDSHVKRWCAICFGRGRHRDPSETVELEGNSCPRCGNSLGDTWFDREVCADPCRTMHTRCARCGCPVDGCTHEIGRLRRGQSRTDRAA
jgi:hypothetical protein